MSDASPLSQERVQQIMGIAHKHWCGFLAATGQSPRSLFDRTTWVNQCALAFLHYCTAITVRVSGAAVVPTGLLKGSGSPSWLWHHGRGVPRILMDFGTISATVPSQTERKTIMRIIIHEVGHLVLHFPHIASLPIGAVPACSEIQEAEAWVFAGAVVGLALGQAASDRRPHIRDNAWVLAA